MSAGEHESEIARNARALDWLRAELSGAIADVQRGMVRGDDEAVADSLADTLMVVALLARRTGIGLTRLGNVFESRLRANLAHDHELERWFGDLTAVLARVETSRERLADNDSGSART